MQEPLAASQARGRRGIAMLNDIVWSKGGDFDGYTFTLL